MKYYSDAIYNMRAKKMDFLRTVKRIKGCLQCGMSDPRALVFHHRDPATKTFLLSQACSYSPRRIVAELGKCDVLCANCHLILHSNR